MTKHLLSCMLVCGCGDGVVFGSNLLSGKDYYAFKEHWIGSSVDLETAESNGEGYTVDVTDRAYLGLVEFRDDEGSSYSVNPDMLQVDGETAWYEEDEELDPVNQNRILVEVKPSDNKPGRVGSAADGLYKYTYSCVPDFERDEDGNYVGPEIKGDYLILASMGSLIYANLAGWDVRDGHLVISGDYGSAPDGGSWCGNELYVYADPPEEDTDPWDGE